MTAAPAKSASAFRTIGEASADIGVPQHVLRFWETRFPQLQPMKRGGNRRYYRPADMALLRTIHRLLHDDGMTIKGVQKALAKGAPDARQAETSVMPSAAMTDAATPDQVPRAVVELAALRPLRDRLARALAAAAP